MTKCPSAYYCDEEAMTHPPTAKCLKGHICLEAQAYGAPMNIYQHNDKGYICPQGMFCVGGETHVQCDIGTYNPLYGSTTLNYCLSCPIGSFCPSLALIYHNICSPGYYCPVNSTLNQDESQKCEVGKYCPAGTKQMISCPEGEYQDLTGQSECKSCSPGNICPFKNCCFNHCEHCNRQDRTYCVKHTMSCSLPHCGKIIGDCCRIICMITKHIICPSCAVKCKKCSKTISIDMAVQCSGCAGDQTGYLCRDTCALTCAWENCGQVMCPECSSNCKVCRRQICRNCQRKCGCCKIGVVCQGENCLLYCNQLKHQTAEDAQICKDCLFMICPECKNICKNCKAITHMTTLPIPGWSNLDLMVKDLSLNEEVQGHVSEIFTAMWHNKHITSVFFSMHNIYIYIYIYIEDLGIPEFGLEFEELLKHDYPRLTHLRINNESIYTYVYIYIL